MTMPDITAILDRLRQPRETVSPGGLVTLDAQVCAELVGQVLWEIRATTNAGWTQKTRIVCSVIHEDGIVETCVEADHPDARNCPLHILDMAPATCREWRDEVWQFHESRLSEQSPMSQREAS